MSFPSVLQPGMLGGQSKWMPCLCFQSIFPSQNTPKTQQVSFLEKYRMCPVDCKLYKLFMACRLQIQGPKQADTRRRLSWSGQLICLQTGPTSSSGREEPVVVMTDGGRLQVEKPGPGSRVMLDTSTIGFEPPWKNGDVGRLCRNPSAGEDACVPEKLYYSKGPCLGSWLLQWLLVPPKRALQCYWFHLEQCSGHCVHHPERQTGPVPPPQLKQRKLRMSWL